jgi:peptidoglycan hydrolase-like protein with peptidoglycan-binding domain
MDSYSDPPHDAPPGAPVRASHLRRWRPAYFALAVLLTVVSVAFAGRDDSTTSSTTTTTSATSTTLKPAVPLTRTLVLGDRGEDVKRMQQRLKDIGFDPNLIDGDFGYQTLQAVWAFQKLVMRIPISGVKDEFTPEMWEVAQRDGLIVPRRPNAQTDTHVEVYLPEQVLIVFKQDRPTLVTHISSGDNKPWCEEVTIDPGEDGNLNGKEPIKRGICGESVTPAGLFYFYNRRSGTRESKLGTMWNPVYFNGGVAVHGAAQVPIRPASHGCIRIPMFISEYFPDLVAYGDRIYIFDGVKEPEEYGSPPPPADRPDPNYTTTTSTTVSPSTTATAQQQTTVQQQTTTVPTTVPASATTSTAPATTVAPTTTNPGG